MDMPGEENPDPTQQNAEGASNALTWINMVAYVICDKSDTRLNDRSAAINNITSKMNSDYKSIFKAGDADIKIVYDEGRDICDNLTICKFLLAVELKEPVDSPEFEQLLAKKFSPVASDDEEEEEEEE
jgi:hypothetical protein